MYIYISGYRVKNSVFFLQQTENLTRNALPGAPVELFIASLINAGSWHFGRVFEEFF